MSLINSYSGIIAGIGDKSINANVIPPEFDARYRKFVAGKNTILDGFKFNPQSSYLSKGYCLAEGYIGGIKEDISLNSSNYVYGVFTVNHNNEITDSFIVEVYDGALLELQQDDILNSAGKYYFQIYPKINENRYPLKAEYSDNTTVVEENGELKNGVTAVTQQDENDNSTKVATDEFVHKVIEKEIGYDEDTISIYDKYGAGVAQEIGQVVFQKKADFIVATARLEQSYHWEGAGVEWLTPYLERVPKFLPISEGYLIIPNSISTGGTGFLDKNYGGVVIYKVQSNGNMSVFYEQKDYEDSQSYLNKNYVSGWKINA